MRPNKVKIAVRWSRMSHVVLVGFFDRGNLICKFCLRFCLKQEKQDNDNEVSEFEHQSGYYFHARANITEKYWRGARGVMVIVVGNGLGDTSSNPG